MGKKKIVPLNVKTKSKPTSVTGNSTVCFAAGFTVTSVTASALSNSPSLLSPPYLTGICSAAMYLIYGKNPISNHNPSIINAWEKEKESTF